MNIKLLTAVLLFCTMPVQAQQKRSFKERLIHYLDSSNVIGTDPAYIGLPEKKWCVTLNSNANQLNLNLDSHTDWNFSNFVDNQDINLNFDLNLKIKPPVTTSLGFYVGYRGWGGGYSVSLSGNNGINMSFNIATPSNGVNIRWRRFDFQNPEGHLTNAFINGMRQNDEHGIFELDQPMQIESFVFDGYWIFNSRRFSLAAAYGQSVLQKRSAGSFIAGLMAYYQKFDISQPQNVLTLSDMFQRLGILKTYQGSIGAGYTYNWVPTPGLVVNAVVMPVVSLFNYIKADNYTASRDKSANELDGNDNEGDLVLEHSSSNSLWGNIHLNIDARASVTYWFRKWFITTMVQGKRFSSQYDNTQIRMTDWEVKAAVGLTF